MICQTNFLVLLCHEFGEVVVVKLLLGFQLFPEGIVTCLQSLFAVPSAIHVMYMHVSSMCMSHLADCIALSFSSNKRLSFSLNDFWSCWRFSSRVSMILTLPSHSLSTSLHHTHTHTHAHTHMHTHTHAHTHT